MLDTEVKSKMSMTATQGFELGLNLDSLVNNHTKSRIMQIYKERFMQEFLERCPSGWLRHLKYRTAWRKTDFYVTCASI